MKIISTFKQINPHLKTIQQNRSQSRQLKTLNRKLWRMNKMQKKSYAKKEHDNWVMNISFLGTGAGAPTVPRNSTSHVLKLGNGNIFMIDCGESTQHRLLRTGDSNRINSNMISCLFVTHMHGDHTFGIPAILSNIIGFPRDKFRIIGPKGIKQFVEQVIFLTSTKINFDLDIIELSGKQSFDLGIIDGIKVSAHPLKHRVPCYGYVFESPDGRNFIPEKMNELPIEGKKQIAKYEKWVDPEGVTHFPSNFYIQTKGQKIVALGDTCDSSAILKAGKDCDVLIHECTFSEEFKQKAILSGHSTSKMVTDFANEINTKNLILTHIGAAIESDHEIKDRVFSSVKQGTHANVFMAYDFAMFDLDKHNTEEIRLKSFNPKGSRRHDD